MVRTQARQHTKLNGRHVLIAADYPAEADDAENAVVGSTIAAVNAVIHDGGKVLTPWHPTLSPMMLHAAYTLGALFSVDIFRICWSKNEIDDELSSILDKNVGWIHWTPPTESKTVALNVMYRRMLAEVHPCAAIFIGGNDDMSAVWNTCGEMHPDIPRYALAKPGGHAALWYETSGDYPQAIKRLLSSESYSMSMTMLMRYVTAPDITPSVQSHSVS